MAMRSAIELGLATATRSRSTLGSWSAGTRAPASSARGLTRSALAVAPAALAARRGPQLAADRRREHAEHRHPVLDQGDRDAPAGPVAQIVAGAVDRIDHPEPPPLDPVGIVERLLGQPAGLRIERAEPLAQEGVDLEVDVADRMAGHLLPASCRPCRSGRRRSARPPRRCWRRCSSTGDRHPVDPQGRNVDRAAMLQIVRRASARGTCRSDCRRW